MPRYMGGARGSLLAGLTTNTIPKVSGLSLADSSLTDDGSTVTSTVPVLLPDGTAAAPSGAGTNYTTTGQYWGVGPYLGFANSGTQVVGIWPGEFRVGVAGSNFNLVTASASGGDTTLGSNSGLGWAATTDASTGFDTQIARAAAATPYFYGSSTAVAANIRIGNTNAGYETFESVTESHTLAAAGTSTTTIAVWKANAASLAASFRITTEITGATSVQVGVAGDTTRYGTFSTLTVGQTIQIGRIDNYAAETGILFTAVGGGASFTAGVVRVNLRQVSVVAPTS